MLKLMRSHKFFSVFFLGFITIAITIVFVFWGIGPQQNPTEVVIAQVNRDRITLSEYERAYEMAYRRAREVYQDAEQIEELNLRKTVLDDLIDNRVLVSAAESAGLKVTDDELQETILNQPAFQRNGVFDREVYERRLKLNRTTPSQFEREIKYELLINKIRRLIGETAELSVDDIGMLQSLQDEGDVNRQLENALLSSKKQLAIKAYIEGLKRQMKIEINRKFIS